MTISLQIRHIHSSAIYLESKVEGEGFILQLVVGGKKNLVQLHAFVEEINIFVDLGRSREKGFSHRHDPGRELGR